MGWEPRWVVALAGSVGLGRGGGERFWTPCRLRTGGDASPGAPLFLPSTVPHPPPPPATHSILACPSPGARRVLTLPTSVVARGTPLLPRNTATKIAWGSSALPASSDPLRISPKTKVAREA